MIGQKVFLSLQTALYVPCRSKLCCKSYQNGAGLNGAPRDSGEQRTVEMHIASTDTLEDYDHPNGNGLTRRNSKHVPPPRNSPPQQLERQVGLSLKEAAADRAEIKAVKAELSITNAELRAKSSELAVNERHLRAREAEISLLRAALTGRDISLRNAKAEAAEAQVQVQDKDTELQNAFEQLLSNSKERASLRDRLLAVQDELSGTRTELENWTKKGYELNQHGEVAIPSAVDREQVTKLLESLNKLSQTIADDAHADEEALNQFAS